MPNSRVRLFKSLFTDAQDVYGDAKTQLLRALVKFDKSLQDAGLLLITRVDENISKIQNEQEGIPSQIHLADKTSEQTT